MTEIVIIKDFILQWLQRIDLPDRKINQETGALNNTLDQMDIIVFFRAFHPKAAECTNFSSAHGMFYRIDHMLGHKTSLNKFKKIEIIANTFSDHNVVELKWTLKNIQRHGAK